MARQTKAQECFAEFVIPSSNSPVAFDFLEDSFLPDDDGDRALRRMVRAVVRFVSPRNAGFNSVGARRLPEGGAIIGFVADNSRIL